MDINAAIGSLYYNHVEYSTFISMLFPAVCIAWPMIPKGKRWLRIALAFVLLVLAAAILLSYARAAMIAVFFSLFIGLAIKYRFARIIMPVGYAAAGLFMAYLINEKRYLDFRPDYEHTYMHHDLKTHLQATFQGTDMSGMERVYRWIAAVRMSQDEPLTGWGPNAFVKRYKAYTVPAFRTYVSNNDEHSTTHNYFLYLLAEQGWPGMLLYALLIPVVFSQAQGAHRRFNDPFYKRCVLALAMIFAAAFINNCFSELTDTHKVGALFFLSMALIALLSYRSYLEPANKNPALNAGL
jgi:O-antigen ligase